MLESLSTFHEDKKQCARPAHCGADQGPRSTEARQVRLPAGMESSIFTWSASLKQDRDVKSAHCKACTQERSGGDEFRQQATGSPGRAGEHTIRPAVSLASLYRNINWPGDLTTTTISKKMFSQLSFAGVVPLHNLNTCWFIPHSSVLK